MTQHLAPGQIAIDEGLIDNRNLHGPRRVGICKIATLQDRRPHDVKEIRAHGVPADFSLGADEIVAFLVKELQPGDVVVAMSNGGFGGIHEKLMAAFSKR